MPAYHTLGEIPRKRHTVFRAPNGALYHEELFGTRGFSGPSSLLYHLNPPTRVTEFEALEIGANDISAVAQPLRHHHLRTSPLAAQGDLVSGRVCLMENADVRILLCRPAESMPYFYKNADGDELLFIHEGSGRMQSLFGELGFRAGDYLVIPRGTIYRLDFDAGEPRVLVLEAASPIEIPRRYRNEYGQLLEHAPYCERDLSGPESLTPHDEKGDFEVRIRARGRLYAYCYDFHPLDVVGWDGCEYPWRFSIHDFEPVTGSLHQPPPVHQTFEARNFVVCSFVPRLLDYHPDAVRCPYYHSNVDSDELLYYVNDRFGSRRGIEVGSMTLHPSGIPHGPQPGAIEASLTATRTDELAVMVDTFHPLRLTEAALALDDPDYPKSWL